jgi:glycolate oxidase FAD binding subunit
VARRAEGGVERLTIATAGGDAAAPPGDPAGAHVTPVTSPLRPTGTADVREIVREAIGARTALRIVGRGTWLDAGRPVAAARRLSLEGVSGIVDYTPGDLTLTARAGTTLAEIARATAAEGQWLALAPWGGDGGSLGATAATATAGPSSGTLDTPRDVVIGLEAVTGSGDVVRGGGRVVKNVAGFDLTRLMVGAWGTLGVLTEVSVRLRGLPERETTVALPAPNALPPLNDFLTRLRAAAVAPLALEMLTAKLATGLELGDHPVLLARLAGNADSVAAQCAALGALGDMSEIDRSVWDALRTADPLAATVVRFSSATARFAEAWLSADRLASAGGGHAHASVLRSSVRVVLPHDAGAPTDNALELLRAGTRDTRIFERLPASLWPVLAPSRVTDRLSRGVRAAFDPHRLLNPGILGETEA